MQFKQNGHLNVKPVLHKMKEKWTILAGATILMILLLELTSRLVCLFVFGAPVLEPQKVALHFYPELARAGQYHYNPDKRNLLVLGGSVVTTEIIALRWNKEDVITRFCNLEELMEAERYNVLSLSKAGHNSLDSWYKYKLLKNERFDFVFAYHGINDTRANNVSTEEFDAHYRHIEFYDDLSVFLRHYALIRFSTIPFVANWTIHSFNTRNKEYIPKELFMGLLNGEPEPFLNEGAQIKTAPVFERNYENMITMARARNQKFILCTYAWYQPEDYTHERFKNKELDYDQQIFPTELYGIPANVIAGLRGHETVIRKLHERYAGLPFIDLQSEIPPGRGYFQDICHLNPRGCRIMADQIDCAIDGQ